ncbi:tRNA 2-selenouridine(34) synthase MnmH [soil metagenome]
MREKSIRKINKDKEIFDYVRKYDDASPIYLKDVFSKYDIAKIDISGLLKKIRDNENILLIDTRSEKEFNDGSIPSSVNFPVLSNEERHSTGLVYKKYSQSAAIRLAMEFALAKVEKLTKFLKEHDTEKKEILINCWRGGGRSSYLSKMIIDLGFKTSIVSGGYKAYRNLVHEALYKNKFNFRFIELSGLTGSGKTELLNLVKNDIPVIDLELAAHHFSSLFGSVPYELKDFPIVPSQAAFENNIFSQIINYDLNNLPVFLVESESRKVGDFNIPVELYKLMESSPSVLVESSLDSRVKRIVRDYFSDKERGIHLMLKILTEKERYFREKLSTSKYELAKECLESGNVYKFSELFINDFYDLRYKDKGKKHIGKVNLDTMKKEEIVRELKVVMGEN